MTHSATPTTLVRRNADFSSVWQHNKQDKNSNHLIHSNDKNHHRVWLDEFEIIGKGFKSNFKRQISEALHIKEKAPEHSKGRLSVQSV